VLAGRVVEITAEQAVLESPLGRFVGRAGPGASKGAEARLYVRPEALVLSSTVSANRLSAVASRLDFEGAFATAHAIASDGTSLQIAIPSHRLDAAPAVGQPATFCFEPQNAMVLAHG
jgi:spermidine/putrescine transport system ATP-binding protein